MVFLRRLWPVLLLISAFAIFYIFNLDQYVNFATIQENRTLLLSWVDEQPVLTISSFMAIYIISIALSLPIATVLTITSGFLFGYFLATGVVIFSATIGACLLFLMAKTVFKEMLKTRARPWIKKLSKEFQENGFNYLLTLRLIPLFPFFIVNIVPAFLGMKLRDYFFATMFGIAPATFVYISVGVGLGSIFDYGENVNLKVIMTPKIIIAFVGLGILSLVPAIYKKFKKINPQK